MDTKQVHWALSREAGLAAAHIGEGVTALGYANYAQQAYYYQAFFALSLGFERAAKLALLVEHAVKHEGAFPTNAQVREYGHGIQRLLTAVAALEFGEGASVVESDPLPDSQIHKGIIEVLDDFAQNITRYYNIDFVTESPRIKQRVDPVADWTEKVVEPIADQHYTKQQRERDKANAELIDVLLGNRARVRHTDESGEAITDTADASFRTGKAKAVAPWVRMYVLQIARFLSHVMSDLSVYAYKAGTEGIPYLSDFFGYFNNRDAYFRRKKIWSLYKQ